jgi:hypothetical protein
VNILNPFRDPDPKVVVERQLHQAQLELLEQEKLAEFHEAMTVMLRGRIERLTELAYPAVTVHFPEISAGGTD